MPIKSRSTAISRPAPRTSSKNSKPAPKKAASPKSTDRVTLSGKLFQIGKGAIKGALIGAAAVGVGVAGALAGPTGALLGVAGAAALGIGLAHKLDMVVPSTYSAPQKAPREKTFYGATAGLVGGAFGAAVTGLGLLTGGPAVAAAAGIAVTYGSALAATRNTIMGVGEQFPNAL